MSLPLPIDPILPLLLQELARKPNCVLSAAPGAGKTTRVPPALLDAPWLEGKKILMLEPRRLAAQRAARFMASELGEEPGKTIGYRIRGESRVSDSTRIEILTEGILTRMLQNDPDLPGVGVILFDEYHERSIHADLGLALALDAQENLRPDLRILVMSATLDGLAVARLLGDAPVIEAPGRAHLVDTRYQTFKSDARIEQRVRDVVYRAVQGTQGDVLVFLPGQREIRQTETLLRERDMGGNIEIHCLYGEAPSAQQQAALAPAKTGIRKIILATSIAETSLTIDGVRVVVDSGLTRTVRFDPRRGMSGLVTIPVSRATAEQRRGRAGRQAPGVCYRVWTEAEHEKLPEYPVPEILTNDLAPLALDIALWGAFEGAGLRFLDPPPHPHIAQARHLLASLGALDERGSLTPHGRLMADLPVHPRLAHMIIRGKALGAGAMACTLAALLEARDLVRGQRSEDIDLYSKWLALHSGYGLDRSVRDRIMNESRRLALLIDVDPRQKAQLRTPLPEHRTPLGTSRTISTEQRLLGLLLAFAYPDRIARRREPEGRRYQMSGGTGAILPDWSLLSLEEYLAVADIDGIGLDAKIFLATPLVRADILEMFSEELTIREEVGWNDVEEGVVARRSTMIGALVIEDRPTKPDDSAVAEAMIEGVRRLGLNALPWTQETLSTIKRSEWIRLHGHGGDDWPDVSNEKLQEHLASWLGPFLAGIERKSGLVKVDVAAAIRAMYSHEQWTALDTLAPATIATPTGHRVRLEYEGDIPVMPVKLQEMFGQTTTPTIAGGRVAVLLHLLSPAGRPLAVTQDLPSFWKNAYIEVRKQMRGRYPKHPWPEDPTSASPTRRLTR